MTSFEANVSFAQSDRERLNTKEKSLNWNMKTILVVEDTPSNFQLLQTYLSRTGVNIIHADNGLKALDMVEKNNSIELIVMDIRLPEMSGLVATKKIREKNSKIPIIAQTAYAMETDRELCLSVGCNEFIPKPFRKQDLLDVLTNYL
jgi:two-component system, cell cycle response regulator DivK